MNNLCVICARTNSQGLKNKNFLKIKGKNLIFHTINLAIKSKIFKDIAISINKKNMNFGKYNKKVNFIVRPNKLASHNSKKLDAIRHAVKFLELKKKQNYDYVFDLDVTSPLRNAEDIRNAFKIIKREKTKNLFSVTPSKKNPYFNMIEIKKKGVGLIKKGKKIFHSRQEAPQTYDVNASIYIWQRDYLFKTYNVVGKNSSIYIMPPERSIDIDSPFDFKLVKYLLK